MASVRDQNDEDLFSAEDDPGRVRRKRQIAKNSFFQQKLWAWRPIQTPMCIFTIFMIFAVAFISIGIAVLVLSSSTIELSKRYDDICDGQRVCKVTMTVDQDMDHPVYFYYKLVNFYQNHRSYVMDYDIHQLQGDIDDTDQCTVDSARKRDGKTIYPCGLIANSFFNDIFVLQHNGVNLTEGNWDGSDISWRSDRETKFKNVTEITEIINGGDFTRTGTRGNLLPLPTDQDFQVWFRVAGLPRFNKLYRKIGNQDLKSGDQLTVFVFNNFDVKGFDGEKHILLSTVSGIGGRNFFLGACYLITGVICMIYAIGMLLKRIYCPRKLGEMKYYKWTGLGAVTRTEKRD